jgi:CRISPR-associated endonuclease Csn1
MAQVNGDTGYGDLRVPECPVDRRDVEKLLASMVVSHKPNRGVEGKLYDETAMARRPYAEAIKPEDLKEHEIDRVISESTRRHIKSLIEEQGFRKAKKALQGKYKYLRVFRDKWVARSPVKSLSERDISNICDPLIRKQLRSFILDHQGETLQDVLSKFSNETNIRSVRIFPMDQSPSLVGSYNKAYMPSDCYRVDIWKIPPKKEKSKYEGVFVSRAEAMRQLANEDNSRPLRKPHPAAKLMMSLCKNDIIELSNGTTRELCRIAGFSTTNNQIDIRPIYASEDIADWMRDTNTYLVSSFWPRDQKRQYFKSINALFNDYQVKQVTITVDGRLYYRK